MLKEIIEKSFKYYATLFYWLRIKMYNECLISRLYMDYFYLFLIAGLGLVFVILQFDKQQRRRVNLLLKNANDVEPLLMQRCMDQKLNRIHTELNVDTYHAHIGKDMKQELEANLKQITIDYNKGKMTLPAYNNKLGELLNKLGRK
jgi:hypothetical protein